MEKYIIVYVTLILKTKNGKTIDADYHLYMGSAFNVLRSVESIRKETISVLQKPSSVFFLL